MTDAAAPPDLRGWVPYAANLDRSEPELQWCHLAGRRLTSPFYEQDVAAALSRPFNALLDVRTTLAETATMLRAHPPLEPAAFVFHTGRCGSTLVAQLASADPANRVVSEPAPLDTVLRAPLARPVAQDVHTDWIRTTVGALGLGAPGEKRLVLKLDSWAVMGASAIDAAFPDVPWLFVVRDPVEVLVSQLETPPMTLLATVVPSELFGVPMPEAVSWSMARYAAHVQATLLGQMAGFAGRAHVIDHSELPDAVVPWLRDIGIDPDATTVEAMRERASRHGKYGQAYTDDRADKQAAAGHHLRAEVEHAAGPAYAALLAGRNAQR